MSNDHHPLSMERLERQTTAHQWCVAAFGEGHATSVPQRGVRLAEEAVEAAQAAGVPREMVHQLVDYVYDREPGELRQELGGLGITILALAAAAGLSADKCERDELTRVLSKDPAWFRQRNETKNAAGFDTGAYPV